MTASEFSKIPQEILTITLFNQTKGMRESLPTAWRSGHFEEL